MAWFGYGPMDGDDGRDLKDELFYLIGVKYDKDYNQITPTIRVKKLLTEKQDEIYDWLRDYNWNKYSNAGNIQQFYIQATMQLFLDYRVKISDRGKKGCIPFIENDYWAEENIERKKAMDKLIKLIEGQK